MHDAARALMSELDPAEGIAVLRDGTDVIVASRPCEVIVAAGSDAFAVLDGIERDGGFWSVLATYELGRAAEPVRFARTDTEMPLLPDLVVARYDRTAVVPAAPRGFAAPPREPRVAAQPEWHSSLTREEHASRVGTIKQLLAAGECYQVNLTRRLRAHCRVDPVALALALDGANPAPHAALLTFGAAVPGVAIVSASPELFLRVEGDRITTRPIKGTAAQAQTLVASAKDAAEHVMIVDLARNDFGRVCRPGSVRVRALATLEAHPGLFHLVSTIEGRRRDGAGLGSLLRATFPPASVTGAPKPRVMQAIEDLEPVRRGAYCGAIGWIDADRGRAELSLAIRTFTVTDDHVDLGVGGGIVYDSDADAEWHETELKAARLLGAFGARELAGAGATR